MYTESEIPETELSARVIAEIRSFIESPRNSLGMADKSEPAWGMPLAGFARGDDPLFAEFRQHIGPFYWLPTDAFTLGHPARGASAEDLTIVSWVLPQTALTKQDNRRQTSLPSERWVRAKYDGELVNRELHEFVVSRLADWGIDAVAPMLLPQWRIETSARYGLSSTWSERHTAYAAGLGTFGLCDGLITSVGKAMRCGSVIMRASIPATPRPYTDHHAYCLHYAGGGCTACIDRCPAGAISEVGHDKRKCKACLDGIVRSYIEPALGFHPSDRPYAIDGCGLCQTGVPCESGIPAGLASE